MCGAQVNRVSQRCTAALPSQILGSDHLLYRSLYCALEAAVQIAQDKPVQPMRRSSRGVSVRGRAETSGEI
jgi:hypothetical protein